MEVGSLESFLEYLDKVHGRTLRVVKCIPPDRLDWTYCEGKFTLGDLVRHLAAIERYMFVENACGVPAAIRDTVRNWQTAMTGCSRISKRGMRSRWRSLAV